MTRYEVRHVTRYTYDAEVTASYGRTVVTPRDLPGQECLSTGLAVSPAPEALTEHVDHFGNRTAYFEVHAPHTRLEVTATSRVDVTRAVPDLAPADGWTWEAAAQAVPTWPDGGPGDDLDVVLVRQLLLPSPLVGRSDALTAFARDVFTPGRPAGEAVVALTSAVFERFAYRSGSTTVRTTLEEVLERREGVCQDFAHLVVGALRSVGLPARYVSGYLETRPPPGQPKLQGVDASHAWASVLLPEVGWVDLDPTNDQLVDDRYVVTAYGRDYRDVPPVKGIIFSEASSSSLSVGVDVLRV